MRLFTEDDVLDLLGLVIRETIAGGWTAPVALTVAIERGIVHPFELEAPGSFDQARSFEHWLKAGEIPDWRKEQLADEAVKEAAQEAVSEFENSQTTDPRTLGGSIAGPGGPHDFGQTLLDTRRAILADYQEVAKIDPEQGARGNDDTFAVLIEGRINQSIDRAKVMFLGDTDFLAALLTEIWGVCERASEDHLRALRERVEERWFKMPHPKRP